MTRVVVFLVIVTLAQAANVSIALGEQPVTPRPVPTDLKEPAAAGVQVTPQAIESPAGIQVTPQAMHATDRVIHVDDIGKRLGESVTLVGRLGEPLATKLQLRGFWKVDQMTRVPHYIRSPVRFVVVEVNGNQLAEKVEFGHDQIKAEFLAYAGEDRKAVPKRINAIPAKPESLDGQQWTMTAYETGRFVAVPREFTQEKVFPVVYATDYNQFRSHIVGVVTKVDQEPRDASEAGLSSSNESSR